MSVAEVPLLIKLSRAAEQINPLVQGHPGIRNVSLERRMSRQGTADRGQAGMWPAVERVVMVMAEDRSEDRGTGNSNGMGPVPDRMEGGRGKMSKGQK